MMKMPIAVIDGSHARRASLVRRLAQSGRHVEPYQDFQEFSQRQHKRELLLVHDEADLLEEVADWCGQQQFPVGILAYAERLERKAIVRAIRAGALDYLAWPTPSEELENEIVNCESTIEPSFDEIEKRARARRLIARLTPRERQVLECMMQGLSNLQIGAELGISTRTVEIHRANMLTKLDANNSPDAVRIGFEAR